MIGNTNLDFIKRVFLIKAYNVFFESVGAEVDEYVVVVGPAVPKRCVMQGSAAEVIADLKNFRKMFREISMSPSSTNFEQ